ncbi:MAG: carbonic anhydrase [Pseudomonadota bacterium]
MRPLPAAYSERYRRWRSTDYADAAPWFLRLAREGQHPRAMVIACCDSRIDVNRLFCTDAGEVFLHRNIANLVPPYRPEAELQATSSAIEYAVRVLKVAHLIVLGHSGCGGIAACDSMCRGEAPELEEATSFVGRWLDLLRDVHADLEAGGKATSGRVFEQAAVLASLANLMSFPFVAEDVRRGDLSLHGLWFDIGSGEMTGYDPALRRFAPVLTAQPQRVR